MYKPVWVILPTRISISSLVSVIPSGSNIPIEHISNGLVRILKLTPVPIYFRGNHLHLEFCSLLLFPLSVKKIKAFIVQPPRPNLYPAFLRIMTNVQWGICGEEGTQHNMRDHTGRHNERKNWMIKTRWEKRFSQMRKKIFLGWSGQEGGQKLSKGSGYWRIERTLRICVDKYLDFLNGRNINKDLLRLLFFKCSLLWTTWVTAL